MLTFAPSAPIEVVWADIYVKGVYLTSCLLQFKLRNFEISREDRATVDAYGCVIVIRHAQCACRVLIHIGVGSALLILYWLAMRRPEL